MDGRDLDIQLAVMQERYQDEINKSISYQIELEKVKKEKDNLEKEIEELTALPSE